MQIRRYPKLFIRSKNELAKHISHKNFLQKEALLLINDVIENKDKYWKDSKESNLKEEKFIRSAFGTNLGLFLKKINNHILAPHDRMLPDFIFGGVSGSSHVMAAKNLLGRKRKRTLLKLDIKRFYEQVSKKRVNYFLYGKCQCSKKMANMISELCCVPMGEKGSASDVFTIARGFATSPRLAIWCNLDVFIKLERLVKKRLKGKDPRISIYVDDIGITASRVSEEELESLYLEIIELFNQDKNQKLPLNEKKKDIINHIDGIEILGIRLQRNRLELGRKVRAKMLSLKEKMNKNVLPAAKRARVRKNYKAVVRYKNYVEKS